MGLLVHGSAGAFPVLHDGRSSAGSAATVRSTLDLAVGRRTMITQSSRIHDAVLHQPKLEALLAEVV